MDEPTNNFSSTENASSVVETKTAESEATAQSSNQSEFTGGAIVNFFMALLARFVSILSLGFAYPFMVCRRERWVASHTYINGRQLRFDGNGGQLFGKYIVWFLFSVLTLGLYWLIAGALQMEIWRTKHTHFEEEKEGESKFTGSCWVYLGVRLLTFFVSVLTLFFGCFWAHCYRQRYVTGHQVIDGRKFYFDGKGVQFFGKCICWVLLTLITLGIYSFWLTVKIKKWTVLHTHAQEKIRFATPKESPVMLSGFTGGAASDFFMALLVAVVTFASLGIAYPFMICWRARWVAAHTYINGEAFVFVGNGADCFRAYIGEVLLCFVTLGIYAIWVTAHIKKWMLAHTYTREALAIARTEGVRKFEEPKSR